MRLHHNRHGWGGFCCLLAWLGASLPGVAGAALPTSIRVASDNNYPPYMFLDSRGQPEGYEVDMWRLFEAHTGIKVDLLTMSWAAAQKAVLDGRADVIDLMYRSPSRDKLYDFSKPYAALQVAIYADRRIRGITDAASLHGLPVGVEVGDACAERLRAEGLTELHEYPSYQAVIDAAVRGDVRMFCMDESPASYFLYQRGALQNFYPAFVFYTGHFHRAVPKGHAALLQVIERGMAEITPAERQAVRERWLDQPFLLRPYLHMAGVALVLVLVAILLMALWVWSLRRTVTARTRALEAERSKLRGFFDASPDAMWVKDRDGVHVDCNDRMVETFGISREVLLGLTNDDVHDAELAATANAMDRDVIDSGKSRRYQVCAAPAGQTPRQLEVIKVPLFGANHTVHGTLCVARDITERLQSEEQLRLWAHAFEHAEFGVEICDIPTQTIVAANPTFARERGYTVAELVGQSVDIFYPPDLVEAQQRARQATEHLEHTILESEHIGADGRRFPVSMDCSTFHDADGRAQYAVVYAIDISGRREAQAELRLAAAAFETQEALLVTDASGVIQRANKAFTRLTGFGLDEVRDRTLAFLASRRHGRRLSGQIWDDIGRTGFWQGEQWVRVKNSQPRVVRMAISAVMSAEGEVSHHVCTMIDLTGEREARARIDRMTWFDPLTELPNRRYLHDRVQYFIDNGGACCGTLILLDLDHFKRINDLRGHGAGDQLLLQVAKRLGSLVAEHLAVARFGGGTFALLLTADAALSATSRPTVADCLQQVEAALLEPFSIEGGEPVAMTASFGWTDLDAEERSPDGAFREAELAMYRAKAAGRNRGLAYTASMEADLKRREALVQDLQRAPAENRLALYLQAQTDREGRVVGAEGLLRFTRPCGEAIPPDIFIPLAEENDLIIPIGDWVLREACAQLVAWEGSCATRHLSLAVNVSAKQFAEPEFVDGVLKVLGDTGACPTRLKLELTETALLQSISDAVAKLERLRAHGVRISLDDFGTGYSSLAYLSRLPLDQIKIDRSFVMRLPADPSDAMLAQTIINMGQGMGMEVIAEGVETEAQRLFLHAHGCDGFQGYLMGRPVPAAAFVAELTRSGLDARKAAR